MKRCPYCGAEYPDDDLVCSIDRHPLPVGEQMEVANEKPAYLTFPDYQWSAPDAWKCLGINIFLWILLSLFLSALALCFPGFVRGYRTGFSIFLVSILNYAIGLLTAIYFARTVSFSSFCKAFGFDRKPTHYVWFGLASVLVLRIISHFIFERGGGKGGWNYGVSSLLGVQRYLALASPLLLAPLLEEPIFRGFVYRAFRGSYSLGTSLVLMVVLTAITHWPHSLSVAAVLSIWAIIQCYVREKSDSLWDCILCHLAFNVSGLLIYETFR